MKTQRDALMRVRRHALVIQRERLSAINTLQYAFYERVHRQENAIFSRFSFWNSRLGRAGT